MNRKKDQLLNNHDGKKIETLFFHIDKEASSDLAQTLQKSTKKQNER